MTSVQIRPRALAKTCPVCKSRRHFLVTFRLGGRGYPVLTAGTFHYLKEAQVRRDVVAGEIAALRDPRRLLEAMRTPERPSLTYGEWADRYKASRIDFSSARLRGLVTALGALLPIFEGSDPFKMTVADQIEAVAELADGRKPSTVREYWTHHRLILDFAGVKPNPARDPMVKLPKVVKLEVTPPTAREVLAILDKAPRSRRLPLIVLEQTGMAVNEICSLEWGDVDEVNQRFRLRRVNVKAARASRARMVQVPEWLMRVITDSCPLEDRQPDRRVFPGQTPDGLGNVMHRACKLAGIPAFSPHDLRHRRASLWHGQGLTIRELSGRLGHSQASMTFDTYTHLLLEPTEITMAEFEETLR